MHILNITIIGLGLIGGSLGLAIKEGADFGTVITGVDRDMHSIELAIERGAVDCGTHDVRQGVEGADIVFLCTPVLQIVPLVQRIVPYLKAGAIVTDVGSTKQQLINSITAVMPENVFFIGGHPMAGREQSGIAAANKDLFRNKWYFLIPEANTPAEKIDTVKKVIGWTGAVITAMNIENHDRYAAVISHVPHVAAAALVNLLYTCPDWENSKRFTGGGFKDTTRIASSNADMWADICISNSDEIINSLLRYQSLLNGVIDAARSGDRTTLHKFFSEAKQRRDAIISESL